MIRRLATWLLPNVRPNPRRRPSRVTTQPTSKGGEDPRGAPSSCATRSLDPLPVSDGPFSCPVCGTEHAHQSLRYRNHVCQECEKRALCLHYRPIRGRNTHMSGGFEAIHYDRGDNRCDQVTGDHRVWIDGRQFYMDEARFGGTVVTELFRPRGMYS